MRKCLFKGCKNVAMCVWCAVHCDGTSGHGLNPNYIQED